LSHETHRDPHRRDLEQGRNSGDTNVAALDPGNRIVARAFIKTTAADGVAQHVHYHNGVGTEGDLFKKLLGGAIGLGLKQIIRECYDFVVADYTLGEIG
jgi:uncharacterized protein (DUF2235 family)